MEAELRRHKIFFPFSLHLPAIKVRIHRSPWQVEKMLVSVDKIFSYQH